MIASFLGKAYVIMNPMIYLHWYIFRLRRKTKENKDEEPPFTVIRKRRTLGRKKKEKISMKFDIYVKHYS